VCLCRVRLERSPLSFIFAQGEDESAPAPTPVPVPVKGRSSRRSSQAAATEKADVVVATKKKEPRKQKPQVSVLATPDLGHSRSDVLTGDCDFSRLLSLCLQQPFAFDDAMLRALLPGLVHTHLLETTKYVIRKSPVVFSVLPPVLVWCSGMRIVVVDGRLMLICVLCC
jgi:hypothetical protein